MPDFLPTPSILIAFTAASIILAITPGPDMTLFVSKTLTQGRRAGLAAVLGVTSGLIVHTVLAASGYLSPSCSLRRRFPHPEDHRCRLPDLVGYSGHPKWNISHGRSSWHNASVLSPGLAARTGRQYPQSENRLVLCDVFAQFVSASDPAAFDKLVFLGSYFVVLGFPICVAFVFGANALARFVKSSPKLMRLFDWLFAGIMGSFALKLLVAQSNS